MQFNIPFFTAALFLVALSITAFINKSNINILSLCIGMGVIKIIERILFLFIPTSSDTIPSIWINTTIYSTHLAIDIILFLFIALRAPFIRYQFDKRGKDTANIHIMKIDIWLIIVMFLYFTVDLAALIENFMRHLEHIGFSNETATQFEDWTWVFYHYSDTKRILNGIEFIVIWFALTNMAKSKIQIGN